MNELVIATEGNLDIGVPAKIMLDAQTIERLSGLIQTQQPTDGNNGQQQTTFIQPVSELNPQPNVVTDIKLREAIPCGTARTIKTQEFVVEATEVDTPMDGQDAKQAKEEAERKANEKADTMIRAMKDNYTCAKKECKLTFSFNKVQIGETEFWEQDSFGGTSVTHKAVITVQGVVTLQCAPRRILV